MLVDENIHDFTYWRELVRNAISEDRVALFAQPVLRLGSGRKLPTEVHGRLINPEGKIVIAEHFMPMSNRHQLTPVINLGILKRLFEYMATRGNDEELAINLAIQDIHDSTFMAWLSANPQIAKCLVFEFTEFSVEHDPKSIVRFVEEFRKKGAEFAIDHFGLEHAAFDSLQRLKPRYVKLSPSYVTGLRYHA